MNKKIIIGVILASFIMIGLTMASALDTNSKEKQKKLEKIDSPLFKIRTNIFIKEKNQDSENIAHKFLSKRIFLIPYLIQKLSQRGEDIQISFTGACSIGITKPCASNDNENNLDNNPPEPTNFQCWCKGTMNGS